MGKLILVNGVKGGVGKSEVVDRTAAVFIGQGREFTLVDMDPDSPTTTRRYRDTGQELLQINGRHDHGMENLLDAYSRAGRTMLVDMPAGVLDQMRKIRSGGFDTGEFEFAELMAEIGERALMLFVLEASSDTLKSLEYVAELFPPESRVDLVPVLNLRNAEAHQFTAYNASEFRKAMDRRGAPALQLRRLDPGLVRFLDGLDGRQNSLAAVRDSQKLTLIERMRVKGVIRDWEAELQTIGELMS